MKLNFKKAGLIVAASGAFLAANAFADGHGVSQMDRMVQVKEGSGATVYGNFGMELHQTSSKARKDADSVGGLGIQEGGNRFGVTFSKLGSGAVKSVAGNIEFQAKTDPDAGGWTLTGRQANVTVNLNSGGALTLGQQNNPRPGSGWFSNAWGAQASEFGGPARGVNGSRYTGVKYMHGFGMGSFAIMLGIDDTDNGDKSTTSTTSAQNALDKTSLLLNLKPMPALGVDVGYNKRVGDLKDDNREWSNLALAVSYTLPVANVHFGFGTYEETNAGGVAKAKNEHTQMALNASFKAGEFTPFVGYKQRSFTHKDENGEKNDALKDETSISVGANFSALGGSSFVGYDSVTNGSGAEGADTTRIMTGLFYSF